MTITVAFTEEDVYAKIASLVALDKVDKNVALRGFIHELRSEFNAAGSFGLFFSESEYAVPEQRAYVNDLRARLRATLDPVTHCIPLIRDVPENWEEQTGSVAKELFENFSAVPNFLPFYQNVAAIDVIHPECEEYIQWTDLLLNLGLYTYNSQFSPDQQRSEYHLRKDLGHFRNNVLEGSDSQINLVVSSNLPNLVTPQDYFSGVVLPIIKNAGQHAFDKSRDTLGRLAEGVEKKVQVSWEPIPEQGMLEVSVSDNGFGISPDVEDVFAKGVSTKDSQESGIGLWAVKEFVESNGGNIWVESVLGEGSTFKFTVPYASTDFRVYYGK